MNRFGIFARPWVGLALLCLLLHAYVDGHYGLFGDELYFIVCGRHPALGYVDQPPLIPWIAGGLNVLFGTALWPFRLIPALAMAATVALTAELARLLGGGRFAQWLAGGAVLLGGVFLVDGLLLTTDVFQPLTWLGCSWCLVKRAQTKDERWWWAFGAVAGVSLMSKYLILFYLTGLAVGIAATPLRRSLARPHIYVGALVALALAAPSVIWQAGHGWPFLEVGRVGATVKNLPLSPLGFIVQQLLFTGPAAALVWIAGLCRFAVRPTMPELRAFPIAYAVMVVLLFALHGKGYYVAPAYPVLFAGGAVAIESSLRAPALRWAVLVLVVGFSALLAPLALPVLPPERYGDYAKALGVPSGAAATEKGPRTVLPLHLAGMVGWKAMADDVGAAWRKLPEDERAKAVFFGRDYGEAAAIAVYGAGPPAIAAHNTYFLWGPQNGDVVIMLGRDVGPLIANYRSAREIGRVDSPYAMAYESSAPIVLLEGPRAPLDALWPKLKFYY